MLKRTLILCALLLGVNCIPVAYSQYSELKEYGLKGKVKSMIRRVYQITDEKTNPDKIDTSKWISKTITYFNTSGNVDSMVNYSNGQNYDPPFDFGINCSKTFYF